MLKHNYSDKINNRYSYTNKFSYSDEGVDETIKDKITTEDQVVTDDVEEPDAGNDGYSEGMAFSYHGYGNDLI
ncbi:MULTISPECIES: hypothetical protein [Wolbachia]|uniref:Uncharacterized protein n=1 Tax=Wolbachia endosymbiont of Sergentomyia squamirostris TaxID=3113640 RepID=A0AAT9GBW2_9RICK|nr:MULTISPECIES: hypothetical protein [Wolbachia]AOV88121.1 hypothetical protein WH35_01720 [Wolbachia endosymbiont of Drosophila incompta]MDE5063232.1 hypothetical protein [Wolbachia endosymbiont of Drosophila chauvacae]MDU8941510.1 hypothetical protein [Wolbachia endosymbiont of Drosophila malagassya]MDX5496251.1 hypothetical protein [Wolbachia endosymbiont of Nomada fabriciana]MDX5507859.1 hypothetical protein [Wolbachia endosymbiont of Hylaeus sinuatus]MDX5518698.1 hypothetical protein [W